MTLHVLMKPPVAGSLHIPAPPQPMLPWGPFRPRLVHAVTAGRPLTLTCEGSEPPTCTQRDALYTTAGRQKQLAIHPQQSHTPSTKA